MEKLIFPSNILIRIKKKIKETKSRCKKSKQVHWKRKTLPIKVKNAKRKPNKCKPFAGA